MTRKITLRIDDREIYTDEGVSVLDAALDNGIYIPHLCHHPDLKPTGACRLCGVEIDNGRMVMACMTKAREGMDIKTDSPVISQTRKTVMELLIADHKMDCLACSAANDCKLLDISSFLNISPERLEVLRKTGKDLPVDKSNPFFKFDPNKCVVCGICIRTCEEIVGLGALGFINRGHKTVIGAFGNKTFVESICESCGECVTRCPVGALANNRSDRSSLEVKTTCVYCGVGCGIYLGISGDQVVGVRGDKECITNNGNLCVKGRYGFNFINHSDRLTTPLLKKNSGFQQTSWDEALEIVATEFARNKGKRFAALASAKCTNEDNYLIQKFARAVMGTNNIDHCARL